MLKSFVNRLPNSTETKVSVSYDKIDTSNEVFLQLFLFYCFLGITLIFLNDNSSDESDRKQRAV